MSEGKSKREVEELLVAFSPKKEFSSSVRREPVGLTESLGPGEASGISEAGGISEAAMDDRARDGAAEESRRSRPVFEPATPESYNYRFSAGKDFTAKLERFAEVLGIEYPHNHLEEIFEEALEIGLEKRDPQRKLERRRRRQAKTMTLAQTSGLPCPGKVGENDAASASDGCGSPATRSRYIPSEVRERVLERAGHQCEYRGGPDGTRCTERAGLEIEHERPFAIFSSHDERYLRAFCRRQNWLTLFADDRSAPSSFPARGDPGRAA